METEEAEAYIAVTYRVSQRTREWLEILAKQDGRSMTKQLEALVREAAIKSGLTEENGIESRP